VGTLFQPSRPGPQDTPAGSENSPSPADLPGVVPTGSHPSDSASAPAPEDAAGRNAGVNPSPDATTRNPLQSVDAVRGADGAVLDEKPLPPLPSPAKPTLPGLSSATPGKIGE
jgi:hypothetical protein